MNGFNPEKLKKSKCWEPSAICLLNSRANPVGLMTSDIRVGRGVQDNSKIGRYREVGQKWQKNLGHH